ncbi:MAG: efflux RND transporter periplasmic adaptor subunit [Opitutaceae bacterium]|jgi:HlyD family secretion protein
MPQSSSPKAVPNAAARKRNGKLKLWLIIGGILVVAILVVVGVKMKGGGDEVVTVTTDKAVTKTITQIVTATGKVQPEVEVRISSEVAGELIDIPVKEGQIVKKGDVLARIKDDFYKAQVDQSEASLAAAKAASALSKAQLAKAENDFTRSDQLNSKKLISESEFISAQTGLDVARADYQSSLAQIRRTEGVLNQARDQIEKTTVFAPMDGSISSLTSKVGERVLGTGQFAGTEIMRVADLTSMEVRVKVNENDIVNVKLGDHSIISIDAFPNRKFEGRVYEISSSALSSASSASTNAAAQAASASDEVTNFLVKARITDAGEAQLRPGMSATVDIETKTVENVVAVPIQSVTVRADDGKSTDDIREEKAKQAQERSGNALEVSKERDDAKRQRDKLKRCVFIVKDGKASLRSVESGIADNTLVEIKTGVKAGEEVVSGSYAAISRRLKDGMKVLIEKPKKEEKK